MAELIEMHSFPIEEVRRQFPALQRQYKERTAAYFDGPGGSQVVQSAIQAITSYMINGGANLHGAFPTSRETEDLIAAARQAAADLTAAKPSEVAFGANMTTLTLALSRAIAATWREGDEIVVTELDHRANVDPWLRAAEDRGVTVRWLKVDRETLTLDLRDIEAVITPRTRLVAVGLASNAVGTINDMHPIATRARDMGALVAVDAVHAAPHMALDRDALGADILLC
ncbi:MAG TPA: aminotransferase class V-fold PLP-dependent enzyme, partial [Bacilli bacterium]|nr:aminotransferase class V-fold PLP-dependent enzyme [Bacilli bacterium]